MSEMCKYCAVQVIFVDSLAAASAELSLSAAAPLLSTHKTFPEGANVEFVEVSEC